LQYCVRGWWNDYYHYSDADKAIDAMRVLAAVEEFSRYQKRVVERTITDHVILTMEETK
jgi:hypothetical protein